ncbi:MAG: HlyD family type I secretion periplasmic adaptor subunit [Arcobacteraceae bacterium]|jgi:HlyD family secretion protein/adhesin transport system membrane fusion protein|nr:HlyD family type I secretion periplasmic adaptor subunit [Arcobacteraceae bacterium]
MNRLFEDEQWNYSYAVVPIMLMFVVFILWASFSELDEVVRGDGKVVPSGQTKVLQHLEGGIISNILVKEGDHVKAGAVIYELSQAFFDADLKTKDIELKSLKAKSIRIQREIDFKDSVSFPSYIEDSVPDIVANERLIFDENRRSYSQKVSIAEDQLQQKVLKKRDLESKKESLGLELKLSNENMKILDQLYKKQVVSKQEYLKELQLKQTLITKITDIDTNIPIVTEEINEAMGKIKAVKSEIKSKLLNEYSDVKVKMNTLEQMSQADLDRNKRQAIVSPVDGIVQKLYFYTVGGIIKSGDKVAEITPGEDALIVEAKIRTSDRALVWAGQSVKIAITAYDSSKYGLLDGKVLFISSDSQTDETTKTSYYLARIEAAGEFAPDLPILPGMVANVNILTGKKTIMEYILKPLKDISMNSLTEK